MSLYVDMHTDFLLHVYIYIYTRTHTWVCIQIYYDIFVFVLTESPSLIMHRICQCVLFGSCPCLLLGRFTSSLSLSLSCLLGGALRLIFICFLALVAPLAAADSHILGQHAAAVFTCFLQIRHFCPSAWATTDGRIKMYSHLCRAGICTCIYSHCTSPVPLVLISTNYVVLTLVFYLL